MDLITIFTIHFPEISQIQIVIFMAMFLLLTIFFIYQMKMENMGIYQTILLLLAFSYLYLVLLSTVFSRQNYGIYQYKLIPFWSYVYTIENKSITMAVEIILNVFLLMPPTVLVLAAVRKRYFVKWIAVGGFLISAAIEILQLVMMRGLFEWDDMIHNTLGVMLCCWGWKVRRH